MSTAKNPQKKLGRNGPLVSAIGFGAMGLGAFYGARNDEESLQVLTAAADRGITFWDTADIYGECEVLIGRWFKENPGRREEIFLCTKFGAADVITPNAPRKPRSDPAYIRQAVARSLSRLGVDHIDLYYQHRVDPNVPIEVVMKTLKEFVDSGKIRYIGLSEASEDTLRRACAVSGVGEKIVALQSEFSPFALEVQTLPGYWRAMKDLGLALVAYSPLGRGVLTGRYKSRADFDKDDIRLFWPRFSEENFAKNLVLVDDVRKIAAKYKATPAQAVLAWVMQQGEYIIPIPGTKTVERLIENGDSVHVRLEDEDSQEIRQVSESAEIAGERYPASMTDYLFGSSLPLSEWKGEQ